VLKDRHGEIASALPDDLDRLPLLRDFRLRGTNMTRLETFVDAAFAFAITMLVIAAQQIPDNIGALLGAFRNVPTFMLRSRGIGGVDSHLLVDACLGLVKTVVGRGISGRARF